MGIALIRRVHRCQGLQVERLPLQRETRLYGVRRSTIPTVVRGIQNCTTATKLQYVWCNGSTGAVKPLVWVRFPLHTLCLTLSYLFGLRVPVVSQPVCRAAPKSLCHNALRGIKLFVLALDIGRCYSYNQGTTQEKPS